MPRPRLAALPLNVQGLILSFLPIAPRTTCPGAAARGSAARWSSTVSLAVNETRTTSAAAQEHATPSNFFAKSRPRESTGLHESVFEQASEEYDRVPLSKLDQPVATPRTPDDSLLSLLATRSYAAAHKLLVELRASGQVIQPRYAFAREAERAFLAPDAERDPQWIQWWELAPAIIDPTHVDVQNLRKEDALMARRAARIADQLVRETVDADAGTASEQAWEMSERFALSACRQGHTRVVAEHLLVRLAKFAPIQVGERVWSAAVAHHAFEHASPSRIRGSYLSWRSRAVRTSEARLGAAERKRRAAHRVQSRTESTLRWYLNRQHEAYRSLLRARGRVVLAHASVGQHELATEVVEHGHADLDSAPIKLPSEVYLSLLRILAAANSYALFERVLAVLRHHSKRLLRVPALQRSTLRPPYFIRAATAFAHEPEPTEVEAFSTFRYQHVVSMIEEGDLFETTPRAGSAVDGDFDDAALRSGCERTRELVAQVRAGEFAAATHGVGDALLAGPLPSANALAEFLDLARAEAGTLPNAAAALSLLSQQAAKQTDRRAWWSAGEMLSAVKRGRYREALLAYKQTFALTALPKSARRAIWLATRRVATPEKATPAGRPGESPDQAALLVPNGYIVSVLMQALVPHLRSVAEREERAAQPAALDRASDLIEEIYADLVGSRNLRLWAPTHSPRDEEDARTDRATAFFEPARALDPYTFVVFLRDRLASGSPPAAALRVVSDMARLDLRPEAPHYAAVLHAYARHGTRLSPAASIETQRSATADLSHLLALFEGDHSRSAPSSRAPSKERRQREPWQRVSPSVLAAMEGPLLLPREPLTVHAYTGILRGLRERGAPGVGGEVIARLVESRSAEVVRWLEEDGQFREEVAMLKRQGCL
ncbi:hypothetical protein JCM8202_002436 [Rhodotorula sphaerocarpa]